MVQVGMAMLLLLQQLVLMRGALVGAAVLPARPGEAAAGCNQQQLTVMVLLLLWLVPRGMAQRMKQVLQGRLRVVQLLLAAVAVAGLYGAVAALQLLQQQQQRKVTRRCLLQAMMQQTMIPQQQQQQALADAQQGGDAARAGASRRLQHEQQQRAAMRGCLLTMRQAETARMPLLLLLLALVALVGAAGGAGPGASLLLLLQRMRRSLELMQLAVMKAKLAWRPLGMVLRLRLRQRPLLGPSAS